MEVPVFLTLLEMQPANARKDLRAIPAQMTSTSVKWTNLVSTEYVKTLLEVTCVSVPLDSMDFTATSTLMSVCQVLAGMVANVSTSKQRLHASVHQDFQDRSVKS